MANVIHSTIKNNNYNQTCEYLEYKHEEIKNAKGKIIKYKPVRDEEGNLIKRDDILKAYIRGDGREDNPENWNSDCKKINRKHNQNLKKQDIKAHQIVLSFSKKDMLDNNITPEKAFRYAVDYTRKVFPGHQAYVVCHSDTDNLHVHIVINSCREKSFNTSKEQTYLEKGKNGKIKPGQYCSGGKLSWTNKFNTYAHDIADQLSIEYGFYPERNNEKAKNKKEKAIEKWKSNPKLMYLRNAILEAASTCCTEEEMKNYLKSKYNIEYKRASNTITLLHPDYQKATRLRSLGVTNEDVFSPDRAREMYLTERKRQEEFNREVLNNEISRMKKVDMFTRPGWESSKTKKPYAIQVALWNDDGTKKSLLENILLLAIVAATGEVPEQALPEWQRNVLSAEESRRAALAEHRVSKFKTAVSYLQELQIESLEDLDRELEELGGSKVKKAKLKLIKEQLYNSLDKKYCYCRTIKTEQKTKEKRKSQNER